MHVQAAGGAEFITECHAEKVPLNLIEVILAQGSMPIVLFRQNTRITVSKAELPFT